MVVLTILVELVKVSLGGDGVNFNAFVRSRVGKVTEHELHCDLPVVKED